MSLEREQAKAARWFLTPALLLIGMFFFLPVVAGLLLSFTDFDIYAVASPDRVRFVGWRNYADLLESDTFWSAVRNTLYFVLVGAPLSVLVSLATALLVNTPGVKLQGLFRTIYFAPVVTPLVAVAIVWRYLYHPRYGLLNHWMEAVGIDAIDWLGDPRWSMPAIILLAVWKNFGYNMIIFVAGLQAIPRELYEAASVDGAGPWWRFRYITAPSLGPAFLFVGITTMVGFFQLFAEPYVMTQGGPLGSTRSLLLLMYEEGFRWWRLGVASTVAVLLFGFTLAGTLLQLRFSRGR